MHRPRYLGIILFAPVLVTLALAGPGCGGAVEQPLVRQFFQASKLADNVTLANIATVAFDAKKDGTVEGFSIVSVGPEQARPLQMSDLSKTLREEQAADEAFTKKKREYQDANMEAIDRVLKAEQKNVKLKGKDAEIQAAWMKWREETSVHAKAVAEARVKLNAEERVAQLSLPDRDVSLLSGTEFTKELTVNVTVHVPEGQSVKKTLVLTMQRAVLKDEKDMDINGRWMITKIQEKQ